MIINVESGGYEFKDRGDIDLEFDKSTKDPGQYTFEKMISGRYQGGILLATVKRAAQEGLFSKDFTDKVLKLDDLTTIEMNNFLFYPYSGNVLADMCGDNEGDRLTLFYIIDAIVERAAKLVAINIASVVQKSGRGKNPLKPVCITADGSTFYKSKLLRGKIEYYVKDYLENQKGIYCEFVKADNVTLVGTAIAGLLG
jgi:hexokinase